MAPPALPLVLAGPLVQRVTPDDVVIWLVTSRRLAQDQLVGEVWDPLPSGASGYIAEPSAVTAIGELVQAEGEARDVGATLFVYRLVLKPARRPWPANRALAYRIAPNQTDWLKPERAEPLLGDPREMRAKNAPAAQPTPFPWAWFAIDPLGRRWSVLSIPAAAPAMWVEAETYLSRTCRGPKSSPAVYTTAPTVAPTRPTSALALGVDQLPADAAAVRALVAAIAADVEPVLATALCSYLLAMSPAAWRLVRDRGVPPTTPTLEQCTALAAIAAHVPLYGLPTQLFAAPPATANLVQLIANQTLALTLEARTRAFGLCFGWGNTGDSPAPPSVGDYDEDTTYTIGAAPKLQVWFAVPEKLTHPDTPATKSKPRVFPSLAIAAPAPVFPLVTPSGYKPPELGDYDNLFAIGVDQLAYVVKPPKQVDEQLLYRGSDAQALDRDPRSYSGLPAHRIYQLTLAPAAAQVPGKTQPAIGNAISWDAKALVYVDAKTKTPQTQVLGPGPSFGVFAAEAGTDRPGTRLATFTDADHGVGVVLKRFGHRVLPMTDPEIYIGNRFRPVPDNDDGLLGDIEITVDGKKLAQPTDPDGEIGGLLASLADGKHTLAISGIHTQPGPPDPTTGPATKTARRKWRQRSFALVVQGGHVIQVDDEPVVSNGVRLLVDPVFLYLVSGIGVTKLPNGSKVTRTRTNKPSIFIVHRPERADARGSIATWQLPASQRAENTAAAYLLARDGTLIKNALDSEVVNHAPGNWGSGVATGPLTDTQVLSVGIEVSKAHDDPGPYTEAQYAHLLWLLGQYVLGNPNYTGTVRPIDVVGHGDVKDVGKDDPGLTFEWSRLEQAGFGLLRCDQDVNAMTTGAPNIIRPFVGPLPEIPTLDLSKTNAKQQNTVATPAWQQQVVLDLGAFPTLFGANPTLASVRSTVRKLLLEIGYHQAADPQVVADQQKLAASDPKGDHTPIDPIVSFRSHAFGGNRRFEMNVRKYNKNKEELLVEDASNPSAKLDDQLKLTAVWAMQVAFYVRFVAAGTPPKPKAIPVPEPPR